MVCGEAGRMSSGFFRLILSWFTGDIVEPVPKRCPGNRVCQGETGLGKEKPAAAFLRI